MSPSEIIVFISAFIFLICSFVSISMTSPFFIRTTGPSIVSQGVQTVALPGSSVAICVPTARKGTRCMVRGCTDVDARPPVLDRPYLRRKPPSSAGYENTGLPAIILSMYFAFGMYFMSSLPFDEGAAWIFFFIAMNSFSQCQWFSP